jgi:Fe-S-cluster containining protein
MDILNNENKTICSSCGGKCCKNMGCHYSPDDVGEITIESIQSLLNTGNVSIDWWEGDVLEKERGQVYYLRVRNVNEGILDPSWGGVPCKLLTKSGCSLSWKNRPKGGRGVIPIEGGNCQTEYSKKQCAIDWYPYQNTLDSVVDSIRYNGE